MSGYLGKEIEAVYDANFEIRPWVVLLVLAVLAIAAVVAVAVLIFVLWRRRQLPDVGRPPDP